MKYLLLSYANWRVLPPGCHLTYEFIVSDLMLYLAEMARLCDSMAPIEAQTSGHSNHALPVTDYQNDDLWLT